FRDQRHRAETVGEGDSSLVRIARFYHTFYGNFGSGKNPAVWNRVRPLMARDLLLRGWGEIRSQIELNQPSEALKLLAQVHADPRESISDEASWELAEQFIEFLQG